jgi:hypothetical protein
LTLFIATALAGRAGPARNPLTGHHRHLVRNKREVKANLDNAGETRSDYIGRQHFAREPPMRSLSSAILVLASLALGAPAVAQPVIGPGPGPAPAPTPVSGGMIIKITAEQLAQILGGMKINGQAVQTSIKSFKDGTSIVITPLWGPQVYSGVLTELCEKDGSGCHWLEYFANLGKQSSVDTQWMNAYNSRFFGMKSYTLKDGALVLQIDMPLWPGVSPQDIGWHMIYFKNAVDDSFKFKP